MLAKVLEKSHQDDKLAQAKCFDAKKLFSKHPQILTIPTIAWTEPKSTINI